MTRLLVTGFEGYGGRVVNPSAELVRHLEGASTGGAKVVARTLPVSMARMPDMLRKLIDELRPDGIMLVGLWPGETMIRLERLAINFAEFNVPDNDGSLRTEPVSTAGPAALLATWPVRRIEERLLNEGIPARLSEHAGTFLCNASLYTALSHASGSTASPIGLMHVPYLPQQVSALLRTIRAEGRIEFFQRQDFASMALEVQLHAARCALEEIAANLVSFPKVE
ncbi:hypothetical protein P9272_33240 [Mesorhizobium sp. WSM4976]|uniref:pyroglutamyl-peptidase I family protein n=1 Tax=Mesorhizobium sp. WSM4976 TaxID=3038549 RepID=UPI002415F166|nr:hypothetical protein [Mesorhizobium sp. WSM4976]MDG4898399.1 hypothetical protein [Mesorhizobium sp. WSM4976]